MKKYSYNVFNRKYNFSYPSKIKNVLEGIDELLAKISEPLILSNETKIHIDYCSDTVFMGSDCLQWLAVEWYKSDNKGLNQSIREFSTEDTDWTAWRNKDLLGVFYRKVTLNEEAQTAAKEHLLSCRDDLSKVYDEWMAQEKEEEKEKNERAKKYEIIKEYSFMKPRSGEGGQDGYYDAEYRCVETGATQRFVSRDVFDVGCYSYPKRVEGTDAVVKRTSWTEDEIDLVGWLAEFGKFFGVRM